MQYLHGVTSGPCEFSGQIGKELQFCEQHSIAEFETIEIQLPVIDSTISTNQQYLYNTAMAVSSGHCSSCLAEQNPGKLSHARWLSTVIQILRLYYSKTSPSNNFFILVNYVVKVYVPMWLKIKSKIFITKGRRHLHEVIKRSCYLRQS